MAVIAGPVAPVAAATSVSPAWTLLGLLVVVPIILWANWRRKRRNR